MRVFLVAIMALAMLALPAAAQMSGKRNQGSGGAAKSTEGPKIDEKAYKAALERIPDPKEKYDPWGGVAPAPAAAAKKK